jgi:hypothetical protein
MGPIATSLRSARFAKQSNPQGAPPMNLIELIPEHFDRFFAFFGPGHNEGVLPARIKELARLKVAALNECDT